MQPGSYDRSPHGLVERQQLAGRPQPSPGSNRTPDDQHRDGDCADRDERTSHSGRPHPRAAVRGRSGTSCRRLPPWWWSAMAARPESLPERLHHGSGGKGRPWSSRGRSWLWLDEDGWLGNRPSRRVRGRSGRSCVRHRQTAPRVVALDHHRRFNRLGRDRPARAVDEDGRVGGDHLRALPWCPPLRASRDRYAGWRRLKRTRRLACGVETSQQRPGAGVLRIVRQRFEHPHPGGVVRVLLVRCLRPGVSRISARTGWTSHGAGPCRWATCGRRGVRRNPPQSAWLGSLPEGLSPLRWCTTIVARPDPLFQRLNVGADAVEQNVPPAAYPVVLPARLPEARGPGATPPVRHHLSDV